VTLSPYDGPGLALVRTEPMDCPVGTASRRCPGTPGAGTGGYTYGDYGTIDGVPEVHADGEIWGQTLWDLRRSLGSRLTQSLVTRAMELSPANPSFLDERNAILQADAAIYGSAHRNTIWRVFAARGMGWFAGTVNGDDSVPAQDFSMPPKPGSPRGALRGTVTDADTGRPVAGVAVAIGGHTSGSPVSYADVTDGHGRYDIRGVWSGTYPKVTASGTGYDSVVRPVTVPGGTTTVVNFAVRRDWAAGSGGAAVTAFDGPDFTPFGCGPAAAIDQSLGTGWGSTSDLVAGLPGPMTPKSLTVRLPSSVQVSSFGVDPNATCGDAGSASTADYRIETSANGTTWRTAAEGTFGVDDRGRLNAVAPAGGTGDGVRFVRFTMITPQVFDIGGSCPGAFSGCDFMDLSELAVYGAG